ncbi:MAG: hypothetical protein HC884_01710 [Chloroflexaceae bacterium]|nr:hypothetical protein [Chloroflexaceae bacterium]
MMAGRGYLRVRMGILVGLVLALAGCMQALNTDGVGSQQPPPAWLRPSASPTNTLAMAAERLTPDRPLEPETDPTLPASEPPHGNLANGPVVTPEGAYVVAAFPPLPETTPTLTLFPTPTLPPSPTSTPTPGVQIVLPTLPVLSNEQRWRSQQKNREVFDSYQVYTTSGSDLWWYDPVNQQHVVLGSFTGHFNAQARFTLTAREGTALEVPYQVNQSYGLQALSPALVQRIEAAGYGEWIEAYVLLGTEVQPRTKESG